MGYFADGMCTPSPVSFSSPFANAGYQKKTFSLKLVVNSVVLLFSSVFFTYLGILFASFF